MSEYIEVGQPLLFTDPNTPTRVGEIVENVSDIYNIPSPRLGMQVFVKSEKKSFVITSLKNKVIGGVDVPEAAVAAFEAVGAKSITWNNDTFPSNMNDFTIAGVYDIKGERTRGKDNLPILNTGGGHSFNARLTVLDSSISGSGKDDDKCITQVLSFSNRLGQGEVYIRTGKGSSLDNLTWDKWSTLQRNVNVGSLNSKGDLRNYIDNGIYSGVFRYGSSNNDLRTFVMVVINDYAIGLSPRRVSQFLYSIDKATGKVSYETRTCEDETWKGWEILNKGEIDSMISVAVDNAIKGIIADAPEAFDTLKEIADWIANNETGAVALANAISANTDAITAERTRAIGQENLLNNAIAEEKGRAEQTEQAIDDKIDEEIDRSVATDQGLQKDIDEEVRRATEAEEEISHNAIAADSMGYSTTTDDMSLEFETLDGSSSGSVTFPSATTKSAGVMSAEDKKKLDSLSQGGGGNGDITALRSLFVATGAEYNNTNANKAKTAPWGETVTHKAGHYYLNGLGDITEEEMARIYNAGKLVKQNYYNYKNLNIKTTLNVPFSGGEASGIDLSGAYSNSMVQIIGINSISVYDTLFYPSNLASAFSGCTSLRRIIPTLKLMFCNNANYYRNTFYNCKALEYVKLEDLKHSVSFAQSPLISQESILFLINKATPTSAITITLHHDAYVKLTSNTEVVTALSEKNASLAGTNGKISIVCATHSDEIIPNA